MDADRERCRSCGRPITWARHAGTGKAAPLEPDSEGRWIILPDGSYIPASEGVRTLRYTNHFATCPQADAWRKQPAS